ncbi:zinc finger protein ZFMSA12A-like [Armigeres subalbatus]|uniref:zinc finger protein ZFMSA12A-like n=1 Tax=Armigeres subalbatus TaxID=124917 RepID=UPI002ED223D9
MKCTSCKKKASRLITHRLCKCCTERLEYDRGESVFLVSNEQDVRKVECDVCQEPVRKEDLQQHQEACTVGRMVYRCTVCDGDYLERNGLWEHLDSHEISDDKKESHTKETKVVYELHKCVLCNDQRGYRESLYWIHVHEEHDGFFLTCSNCNEHFRSQKLKIDHDKNHCKASTAAVDYSDCEDNVPELDVELNKSEDKLDDNDAQMIEFSDCGIELPAKELKVENDVDELDTTNEQSMPKLSIRKQCSDCGRKFRKQKTFVTHRCNVGTKKKTSNSNQPTTDNNKENKQKVSRKASRFEPVKSQCPHCQRVYKNRDNLNVHIRTFHRPSKCKICGLQLANYSQVKIHKEAVHLAGRECPYCRKMFKAKNFQNHVNSHLEASHLCPECGGMFKSNANLQVHLRRFHTPGKTPRMSKGYTRKKRSRNEDLNDVAEMKEETGFAVSENDDSRSQPEDAEMLDLKTDD